MRQGDALILLSLEKSCWPPRRIHFAALVNWLGVVDDAVLVGEHCRTARVRRVADEEHVGRHIGLKGDLETILVRQSQLLSGRVMIRQPSLLQHTGIDVSRTYDQF